MIIEYGEWAPDSRAQFRGRVKNAVNVVPIDGGYRTLPRWTVIEGASGPTTAVVGGFEAIRESGLKDIIIGTDSDLYALRSGESTWTNVSQSAGVYTTSDFWEFAQFGRYVIAVNGNAVSGDAPQVYDTDTASVFADLGGSPPSAKHIATVRDFVVLGNTWDATDGQRVSRIRWSGFGDHESWAPSASTQADLQDLQATGGAVKRIVGGAAGMILRDKDVQLMEYVGPPLIFRFRELVPDVGIVAEQSVIRVGAWVYFWSTEGFIGVSFDGQIDRIGAGKVNEYLINTSSDKTVISGSYDGGRNLLIWHISPATRQFLIFSLASRKWSRYLVDLYDTSSGTVPDIMFEASRTLTTRAPCYIGGTTRTLRQLQTDVVTLYVSSSPEITTSEMALFPNHRAVVSRARALMDVSLSSVQVTTFEVAVRNVQTTPTYTATALTESTGGADHVGLVEGRYHTFRVAYSAQEVNLMGLELTEVTKLGRW